MNKYNLRFLDLVLEKQYQIHKVKTIQFAILTIATLGGVLTLLVNIISNAISLDYTRALVKAGVCIYLLLQYYVIKRSQAIRLKYCNFALMMANFSTITFEIVINPSADYYDGFLFGSNQMLVHLILSFSCNFELGAFSTLILTTSRIIIVAENSFSLSIQQYIYTFIVGSASIFMQYYFEKLHRESFLVSLKDNTWEILVPLLLKKPFFIFTFNQEKNMYISLMSNQRDFFHSDSPLTHFLFNAKVKKKNLENYLIKKTNLRNSFINIPCLFNQQITVEYQLKKLTATVVGCKFERIVYAVLIDSEDPHIKEQNLKYNQTVQYCKDILNQQIASINKVLGTYLQSNFSPLIRNLRISLFEIYYKQQQNLKLQQVKIKKLLTKCIQIFETPNSKVKIDCNENLRFVTIKSTLIIFLFEIFKIMDQNQSIFLMVNQTNSTKLFIYGVKNIPDSQIFDQCKSMLVENTILTNQYFCFEFMKSPQLSYNIELQLREDK